MSPAAQLLHLGVTPGRRMTPGQRALLHRGLLGRRVVLYGATGAVGLETLALLDEAGHDPSHILALASEQSAGLQLPFGTGTLRVQHAEQAEGAGGLHPEDLVILALSAELARALAPRIRSRVALVVDHSSAFRLDPAVPLVIPEINPTGPLPPGSLAASPNCTTTIALLALVPLHRAVGLRRVSVCSYQAVSGAGLPAVAALESETRAALQGHPPAPTHFPLPIGLNSFPHESPLDPAGLHSEEELKLLHESRRILGLPELAVEATCVRVPVVRTHMVALRAELARPATLASLARALAEAPGLRLVDHPPAPGQPGVNAIDAAGRCDVLVGRLRPADPAADPAQPVSTVSLMAAGDQLLKGAAWNGLQIAVLAASR